VKLLTFHGSIVRLTPTRDALSQACILATPDDGEDVQLARHNGTDALRLVGFTGEPIEIEPGRTAFCLRLRRGDRYFCAEPNQRTIEANRARADVWETFLQLTDEDVALLRHMLAHLWFPADLPEHERHNAPAWPAELQRGFRLTIGEYGIDLAQHRPLPAEDGGFGSIVLPPAGPSGAPRRLLQGPAIAQEISLRPAALPAAQAVPVDRAGFLGRPNSTLRVAGTDCLTLPIFVAQDDAALFFRHFWNGMRPILGDHEARCEIRREQKKFVLLQRYFEGILFDRNGTYSEAGYLNERHPPFPAGLRRDGDTIKLDHAILPAAPLLAAPHVVCFNPHLQNYYHWLVESVLPLDVMRGNLPSGTRLLLPGTLAQLRAAPGGFNHRAMLALLGFEDLPVTELNAPLCRLEEAIWLQGYDIYCIPGAQVRAFRDRIAQRLGTGRPRTRRIYIQRQGARGIANAAEVESFLLDQGFAVHRLEGMPSEAQIALFQEAEFVVAAHGAGLSNLLFCATGTRVIELSPDLEFRPFFLLIGQKLGLPYGVLPCAMTEGHFHSAMQVNIARLRALFRMVEASL
jgi:hypothetical protein